MSVEHALFYAFNKNRRYAEINSQGNEQVLLFLRAHPITNSSWIMFSVILIAIPLVFGSSLNYFSLNTNQVFFLIVFWYAYTFSYILTKFYFWYFNIGVVTNKRIIDIDVLNLLNTNTSATKIDKVEEVNKKTLGLAGSFFDYGCVYVETAGANPNIEFNSVPQPAEVIKIINSTTRSRYGSRNNN